MRKREYDKLKKKIEAEYQNNMDALDLVFSMLNEPLTLGVTLADEVRGAIEQCEGGFTVRDVQSLIDKPLNPISISGALLRFKSAGLLEVVQLGKGRRPTTYRKALAAVKEASDVKADKPKWQSPIRECDTYWKKMKGYIHLMTHPAEGFTDWKETPPRGCDTKSVPYRMGNRLNLSLMSQDPLWQFYHTVFWSEDPDACPPT